MSEGGNRLKIKRSGVQFPLPVMCRKSNKLLFSVCLCQPSTDGHLMEQKHWAKATIHQITMLATFKNVLFPDHKHLLTTGTDDPTL